MSEPIYANSDLTKNVRESDGDSGQTCEDGGQLGDRGEQEERLVDIDESVDRGEKEERLVDIYESVDRGQTEERLVESEGMGEKEERVVDIYESVDRFGILPGPEGDMRDNAAGRQTQGQRSITMRRPLIEKVAVCLGMLCFILLGVIIVQAVQNRSAYNQLRDNLTLTLRRYENLTLTLRRYDNLTLTLRRYDNLTQERINLESEVNKLKNLTAVKSCPNGWQKFGCSCYYSYDNHNLKTWKKSREKCLKTGADLVIINNEEEQEFIRGLTTVNGSFYETWIGLNKTGGNWTWVDGTTLTTQYWASGSPENNENNCIEQEGGNWTNRDCDRLSTWICEK